MEKYQSCFCCTGHEWFLEQVEWLCYQESLSHPINFEATLLLLTVGSYHVNMDILLIESPHPPPPPKKKKIILRHLLKLFFLCHIKNCRNSINKWALCKSNEFCWKSISTMNSCNWRVWSVSDLCVLMMYESLKEGNTFASVLCDMNSYIGEEWLLSCSLESEERDIEGVWKQSAVKNICT
jgi:hypothetical protein